jgi:hypothetical protein
VTMSIDLTPGQKAARTKLERYGREGLREIALVANANRWLYTDPLESYLARSANAAIARADRAGLELDPNLVGWALSAMEKQGRRCLLSGLPFKLDVLGTGKAPRPFAPSIDRIDSRGGYVRGNVRVVCWGVNCLLGTWGDKVAREIARGMVRTAETSWNAAAEGPK